MKDPIRYRDPELVVALIGYVYDADSPVPWIELLDVFRRDDRSFRTLEGTIYDLVAHGAFHRIGKPGTKRAPDTRALKPTPLGRAWLDRELLPLPTEDDDEIRTDLLARLDVDELLPVHTLEEGTEEP